jgi:hypothetical protein
MTTNEGRVWIVLDRTDVIRMLLIKPIDGVQQLVSRAPGCGKRRSSAWQPYCPTWSPYSSRTISDRVSRVLRRETTRDRPKRSNFAVRWHGFDAATPRTCTWITVVQRGMTAGPARNRLPVAAVSHFRLRTMMLSTRLRLRV